VRIAALSVFEGVIYHCHPLDLRNPARPTVEVDARTQPGDLDSGPLLLTVADYARMVGDARTVRACVKQLEETGRITEWMGVPHIKFPTWTVVEHDDA